MDILGIGPLELIVILIVALAIFGPDRLPEIGAKLGKGMRQMRRATREFSQEIEKAREAIDPDQELSQPFQEIGGTVKSAAALAQAARNPGQAIRDSVMRELKPEAPVADSATAAVSTVNTPPPTRSEPAPAEAPLGVAPDLAAPPSPVIAAQAVNAAPDGAPEVLRPDSES